MKLTLSMKLALVLVAAFPLVMPRPAWSQEGRAMKVRLTLNGEPLAATLYDNAASRDLLTMLPLELTLEDYASAEKIAYLSRKLDTVGAPAGFDPSPGDIAYYAPWGNVAIFYRDQPYASGLVSLGKIESGIDALKRGGKLKLAIDVVK